jgi:hypothetical protein
LIASTNIQFDKANWMRHNAPGERPGKHLLDEVTTKFVRAVTLVQTSKL